MTYDTPKTIEIPLTKGYVAIVDECDADLLAFKWSPLKSNNGSIYARANNHGYIENRSTVLMHRLIASMAFDMPLVSKWDVDHKNLNTLDNRRENLRVATRSQNKANGRIQSNSTSGYKGVSLNKKSGTWRAQIKYQGKQYYLGCRNTPEEAYLLYCEAALKMHGEFARLE